MLRQGSSGKSSLAYVGNEITPDQGGSESAYSGGDNSSVAGSETGQPTPEGMTGTNLGNAAAGSNESGTQLAMRTGSGQGDSSSGVTTGEVTTANRDYLISLTMKPAGAPVGQSFDFTDTPYPTSNTLAKDSKVTFIFDLSKQVKRESVQVVTFDGAAKNTVSLESLGNDMIDMSFNQPTAEAYVWVYGESEKGPFSYKLSIPVE